MVETADGRAIDTLNAYILVQCIFSELHLQDMHAACGCRNVLR